MNCATTKHKLLAIMETLEEFCGILLGQDMTIHANHENLTCKAFNTDRVMCVSFHKYDGSFFPQTGDVTDIGEGAGRYCSVNVPLNDGIDDNSYEQMFKPVMREILGTYGACRVRERATRKC